MGSGHEDLYSFGNVRNFGTGLNRWHAIKSRRGTTYAVRHYCGCGEKREEDTDQTGCANEWVEDGNQCGTRSNSAAHAQVVGSHGGAWALGIKRYGDGG